MEVDNFKTKYFKYKSKYLRLKLQAAGAFPDGRALQQNYQGVDRPIISIPNGGRIEGFNGSLQCMWISILDYLKRNGHPNMTLAELRDYAGITGRFLHEEFDNDNANHRDAFNFLAELFDLQINVYVSTEGGKLDQRFKHVDSDRIIPGFWSEHNGSNTVNIISFGRHFELIVGGSVFGGVGTGGVEYVPAIKSKDKKYLAFNKLKGKERIDASVVICIENLENIKNKIILDITESEINVDAMDDAEFEQFLKQLDDKTKESTKDITLLIDSLKLLQQEITNDKNNVKTFDKLLEENIEGDRLAVVVTNRAGAQKRIDDGYKRINELLENCRKFQPNIKKGRRRRRGRRRRGGKKK